MNLKKIMIVIAVVVSSAAAASAQMLWTSADIKVPLSKAWSVQAEADYRTHNHLKSSERVAFDIGASYKWKFLKADAGYVFIDHQSEQEITRRGNIIPPYWIHRHRAYASLQGKIKIGRFELSLRERYQFTHRVGKFVPKYASDGVTEKDPEWIADKDRHILRSRVGAEYNIRKSRFTPFATIEAYDNLGSGFDLEKIRFTVGTSYKINKHNSVELYYRYIYANDDNADERGHIIGVGYSFKL